MADGRGKLIKQTRHINSGNAAPINTRVSNNETKCFRQVFLPVANSKKPALILKKQYPSKENNLLVISCVPGELHSIYIPQSELCGKQEEDNILLNNRNGNRITTTYPPTYNCTKSLFTFIIRCNTIFTN